MSNLHSNNDIRCGLIMSVKINTAYVEHIYSEFMDGGELKYIRGEDTIGNETSHTNMFWDEFSTKYCNMFERWSKEDHNQELYYLFQEHLEDWKAYFIWYKTDDDLYYTDDESEEESDEDLSDHECGDVSHAYNCKCYLDKKDSESDSDSDDEPLVPIEDTIIKGEDGKYYKKTFDDDWNEILEEVEKPKKKITIKKKK